MDVVDVRRCGNGVAQLFPTYEALHEYTINTGSHFPCYSPKAGNPLRCLVREHREKMTVSATTAPLVLQPDARDGSVKAKARDNTLQSSLRSEKRRWIKDPN